MDRQSISRMIAVALLLAWASGAGAANATFDLLPTYDTEVGNDPQMGPNSSSSSTSMGARNVATRRRVAYVTYDLTGLRNAGQMFMNVSFSNYGHDTGKVDVYGVLEPVEALVKSGLTWNNAPGVQNNPTPASDSEVALDLADLTGILLTFDAPARGTRVSTPVSEALAEFLNSDTNGFVAFVFAPNGSASAMLRTVEMGANGGTRLQGEVGGVPVAARDPNPADGATDVYRDAVLTWTAGQFPAAHDVYFGTSPADVEAASAAAPGNVQTVLNLAESTFDPAGHLELGQTYYWRVDEVNAPPEATVHPGQVWSFTVEPDVRLVENIIATASSFDPGADPQNTVNASGLDPDNRHSMDAADMWLTDKTASGPAWIHYEFDRAYKLHEMWVWNYNVSFEWTLGFGLKDVTVEYSIDGVNWTSLGDFEFVRGPSQAGYAHDEPVDFGGAAARYVRILIASNWSGSGLQYGLSEVQFYYVPAHARNPQPAPAATDVDPSTVVLSWWAGREAGAHELYLGVDRQAVLDGTAPRVTLTQASYAPPALEVGTTYYWKVVEVNEARTPPAWESDLWSFSTRRYFDVDDFERYTNESPDRMFQTWIDGWGYSVDEFFPVDNPGNGTGSAVGHDIWNANTTYTTIAETGAAYVHGGAQSMPLYYDNSSAEKKYYSETQRFWDEPQDWTINGADTLRVCFLGNPVRFIESPPGAITMSAAGTDISGTADQFTFARKPLSGDGSITVRVDSVENTNAWAKAGVMIRESLTADARNVMAYVTPDGRVGWQFRQAPAGTSDSTRTDPGAITLPHWLRLTRTGITIKAEHSSNGVVWEPMVEPANPTEPTARDFQMTGDIFIGLALTSHQAGVGCTAQFSQVATSAAGAWEFAEIGVDHLLNDRDDLYVALQDAGDRLAVKKYEGATTIDNEWVVWEIPFSDFTGVNAAAIRKMFIGVGDRNSPRAGGAGIVFIDDIGYGRGGN